MDTQAARRAPIRATPTRRGGAYDASLAPDVHHSLRCSYMGGRLATPWKGPAAGHATVAASSCPTPLDEDAAQRPA